MVTKANPSIIPCKRQSAIVMAMAMQRAQQGLLSKPQLDNIVKGLQQYELAERTTQLCAYDIVAEFGNSRLLSYRSKHSTTTPPLFIIPSVINSARVFDLTSDQSFIRHMLDQTDAPIYLLDWADLGPDKNATSIEKLILERLLPALQKVQQTYNTAPVLLGYCLGGLLAIAAASIAPSFASALITLATPWNFADAQDSTANRARLYRQSILPSLKISDVTPSASLYSFFAHLPNSHTPEKFEGFLNMQQGSKDYELFLAVEDWAQEGTDIPSPLLEDILTRFYAENLPHKNLWEIDGKAILPHEITLPSLHIAPLKDRIISNGSATSLARQMGGDAELYQPDCGHIGIMASRHSKTYGWDKITTFLLRRKVAALLS